MSESNYSRCPACHYGIKGRLMNCPRCGMQLREQAMPVTTTSEEEWAAAIRYANEHAGELRTSEPLEKHPAPPLASLGQHIFNLATEHNRALAAFYRLNPPHGS